MNEQQRERVIATLDWDDRAEDVGVSYGLGRPELEAIIRHADRPLMDSHSTDAGHLILRFTVGDVVVVVGFKNPDAPKVLHVHVRTDQKSRSRTSGSQQTARGGAGSSLPTSARDLRHRIVGLGYRLEQMRSGHLAVIDRETDRRVSTISGTPGSSSSVADDWKGFLRVHSRRNP